MLIRFTGFASIRLPLISFPGILLFIGIIVTKAQSAASLAGVDHYGQYISCFSFTFENDIWSSSYDFSFVSPAITKCREHNNTICHVGIRIRGVCGERVTDLVHWGRVQMKGRASVDRAQARTAMNGRTIMLCLQILVS
ncbi:hypothetical protein E2C01_095902 [Portunus trituberculatus]|uniref:Uncharacterized protein n=1 Tax=Portunus trituberculatus TaxID=210409 RepID=A0A5B7JU88_PORTR|nr:hypothetical protein [Portunus trituberculatus]